MVLQAILWAYPKLVDKLFVHLQKILMSLKKNSKNKIRPIFSIKAFFRAYLGALQARALFFYYPVLVSKETLNFFKCLENNSRIVGYKFLPTEKKIQIFLSHDVTQSQPIIPKIIYYSSPGRTKTATVKLLEKFQEQHPFTFTLIRTQFGILDLKDCLFYKCGGEFLVSVT